MWAFPRSRLTELCSFPRDMYGSRYRMQAPWTGCEMLVVQTASLDVTLDVL